jgi:hypothetical protein
VSTVGLTSAGVEVLIFKLYPISSALGNSKKNQALGSNLHGFLIGIYLFYENWSTETFRNFQKKRGVGDVGAKGNYSFKPSNSAISS